GACSTVNDADTVAIGTEVFDTSSLDSNATSDFGGSVAYFYAGPLTAAQAAAPVRDDTGPALGGGTITNQVIPDSNELTLSAAGIYEFWAIYSGDGNNNG